MAKRGRSRREPEIKTRNMRYRRGDLDGIEFAPKETPKEDFER